MQCGAADQRPYRRFRYKSGPTLHRRSHLLDLWVKNLPGASLKPVHVHCAVCEERMEREERSRGKKECLRIDRKRWRSKTIRRPDTRGGVHVLLIALTLIQSSAQAKEFVISCAGCYLASCRLSVMKSAAGYFVLEKKKERL